MSTYRLNVFFVLTIVGVLLLQFVRAQSDIYNQYEQKRQAAYKYCGKQLANTLQLVCHGVYNSMFKKNGQEMRIDDDYPNWNYDLEGYPFRSRASARAMMGRFAAAAGRFRRDSRGVHDECCVKPCSIDEMMGYCGKPL